MDAGICWARSLTRETPHPERRRETLHPEQRRDPSGFVEARLAVPDIGAGLAQPRPEESSWAQQGGRAAGVRRSLCHRFNRPLLFTLDAGIISGAGP